MIVSTDYMAYAYGTSRGGRAPVGAGTARAHSRSARRPLRSAQITFAAGGENGLSSPGSHHLSTAWRTTAPRPVSPLEFPMTAHSALTNPEIEARLATLPAWSRRGETITRTLVFPGFPEAVAFVTRLVEPA